MSRTLNWESVEKDRSILSVGSYTLEIARENGTVKAVDLVDGDETILRITAGQYCGIDVLQPKQVEVYQLEGVVLGVPVLENYEHAHQAETRRSRLLQEVSELRVEDLTITKTYLPADSGGSSPFTNLEDVDG